jgi:DNA transposition AAA+ family ATPase
MTDQDKSEIIRAAVEYMNGKGLSQNAMCQGSKINVGYLSYMLKGQFSINGTVIDNKWFVQLADFIGLKIQKTYFGTRETPEFINIINVLQDAKKHPKAYIIIGNTGVGKTFSTDKFQNQHPVNTFRITVAAHHKIGDILNAICELAGSPTSGNTFEKERRLAKRISEIRRSGGDPVIIIDEAENLKTPVLQLLKSLYDRVIPFCSLVLIGTPELLTKLYRAVSKGVSGMPQFLRRWKAGIRVLPGTDLTFSIFLNPLGLERGLVKLIQKLCSNYGELYDYLEPVFREADRLDEKVTEKFFRKYHNIPEEIKR